MLSSFVSPQASIPMDGFAEMSSDKFFEVLCNLVFRWLVLYVITEQLNEIAGSKEMR